MRACLRQRRACAGHIAVRLPQRTELHQRADRVWSLRLDRAEPLVQDDGRVAVAAALGELRRASQEVRQILSDLEMRGWARVEDDHEGTRHLVYRAEWVLSIVSGLTLLLSVWISFVLPRQVVKPLIELRTAVDQAVSGNYEIEFELQGEGELVNLARSIRNLISHARLTV